MILLSLPYHYIFAHENITWHFVLSQVPYPIFHNKGKSIVCSESDFQYSKSHTHTHIQAE